MKTIKKTKKIAMALVLLAILTLPTTAQASLQSRPGATSLVRKTASEFFLLSRQMETASGPMGLNATIEVNNDKVEETSSPNNIDVHMIKNTEYGTAAMLAASAYGNCPVGSSSSINDSTTQNQSGIMQMAVGKYEYVAGIYNTKNSYNTYIYNADAWHRNVYNSNVASESYIPGDATYETEEWKGASSAYFVYSLDPVFKRSGRGVFNYEYLYNSGQASSSYGSRAAVVCGAGL